jgi:hypothetical protein
MEVKYVLGISNLSEFKLPTKCSSERQCGWPVPEDRHRVVGLQREPGVQELLASSRVGNPRSHLCFQPGR